MFGILTCIVGLIFIALVCNAILHTFIGLGKIILGLTLIGIGHICDFVKWFILKLTTTKPMKNYALYIIFLGTLLTLTTQAEEGLGELPKPIERTITDLQGRALVGTILGKQSDKIRIKRKSDGREFKINANTMSPVDLEYLKSLPEGDYDKTIAGANGLKLETINTPNKVFLALPFEKQDRTGICTAGALLNVLKYGDPKLLLTQDELFMLFASGKSGAGYNEMQPALRSLGYDSIHTKLDGKNDDITVNDIRKSLTANIPVLAATSSHMVTVVGYDISDPTKKTLAVWDQRESKVGATDSKGLGIENMEEKDFAKKYKSVILIKPNLKLIDPNDPDKYLSEMVKRFGPEVRQYTMTPPVNEPNLQSYLKSAVVARIVAETRRNNKVVYKHSSSEYHEIVTAPDPSDRKPKWIVKQFSRGNPKEIEHEEILRKFAANDGVFYVIPTPK